MLSGLQRALLDYHHRAVRLPRAGRVAAALARQIGHAASVLDVGCDDGRVAREVGHLVGAQRLLGVDLKLDPDVAIEAVTYDGRSLPFEDAAFDAVTVADVLHHAEHPAALLREALRVARVAVAVKDHFRFGPASERLLWLMDRVGNARHEIHVRGSYLDPAGWVSLVAASGGRIAALEWPLRIHDYPWRLVTQDRLQFASRVERGRSAA